MKEREKTIGIQFESGNIMQWKRSSKRFYHVLRESNSSIRIWRTEPNDLIQKFKLKSKFIFSLNAVWCHGFFFLINIFCFVFVCSHALIWSLSIFFVCTILEVKCIGGVFGRWCGFKNKIRTERKETSHLIRKIKNLNWLFVRFRNMTIYFFFVSLLSVVDFVAAVIYTVMIHLSVFVWLKVLCLVQTSFFHNSQKFLFVHFSVAIEIGLFNHLL